jgi:hypothetical protein
MSDLSLVHRSLGLLQPAPALVPTVEPAPAGSRELPLDELEIRHLVGAEEIARVVHLRSEIQLPAATLADPEFAPREKKETSTVLWPVSSGAAPTLELSASFRSGSASRPVRTFW